jgi:aquaporin Z
MDSTNPMSIGVLDEPELARTSMRDDLRPASAREGQSMVDALLRHWPEYFMEAFELALFMLSACAFTVLLFHPLSPVAQAIPNQMFKRVLMGVAMGSTAIAIIFSPFGKRSGAHFNPAVTLTFLRLGKVQRWDAAFYTLFQFAGAIAGVTVAWLLLGNLVSHASVNYATTIPGATGPWGAFVAEVTISFIQMSAILRLSNSKRLARWTGVFAGLLVATYISIESPFSGMSMNPARTFGSASVAQLWTALWVYFTAPPIGMLLAAETYRRFKLREVFCAKLHHHNNKRCIFRCNFSEM